MALTDSFTYPDFQFEAKHLRKISELNDKDLHTILNLALYYAQLLENKKDIPQKLRGRTQINLFFEDSTRTNLSFDLAGKKLGADVINVPVAASSINKNEDLIDTVQPLAAMGADAMIVRAKQTGIHDLIASRVPSHIINAGDGTHEHPTQALLDCTTMISEHGTLKDRTIAIIGDIRHSRVAGSGAKLFSRLGANIRFIAPKELLPCPEEFKGIAQFEDLKEGLTGCDFAMALRMQFERMDGAVKINREDFYQRYALTHDSIKFAKPGVKVMHPGPMNRGIEIEGALADNPAFSLILRQVFFGVPVRMAVLDALINRRSYNPNLIS